MIFFFNWSIFFVDQLFSYTFAFRQPQKSLIGRIFGMLKGCFLVRMGFFSGNLGTPLHSGRSPELAKTRKYHL